MPHRDNSPPPSTAAEFAEGVGRAVLAWQDVELRCAHLYVWLLDARNAQGALTSFHAVHSLNVRAMMLKTAAKHLFQSPDFEDLSDEFDALIDRLGEQSRFRNRLTHSEVAEEMTDAGWSYTLKAPAIETAAAGYVRGGGGGRPKFQPLDFPSIKAAESHFRSLAEGLHAFEEQIRERLESL
ncbi:MAG: hypothetical protein ABL894_14550 [Hyphomicrobium sp.]